MACQGCEKLRWSICQSCLPSIQYAQRLQNAMPAAPFLEAAVFCKQF